MLKFKSPEVSKGLLDKVAKAITADKALGLWSVQEHREEVVFAVHTVVATYSNKAALEKTFKHGGLQPILLAEDYTIWSKDLCMVQDNKPYVIVIQACVYNQSKQVVFRMY